MQDDELEERGKQVENEDDQVICSNQLLAVIRQRMAKRRSGSKEDEPRKLDIEDPD